jgi:gluconate 2-dehydrogenase gamma chain
MTQNTETFQTLTKGQASVVEAAAARIMPTTDTPGATEAGAVVYIDRTLTEAFPGLAPLYRAGVSALNKHARRRGNATFAKLSEKEQDAVLTDFEAGKVPDFTRASAFFETLRKHTMEGFLGEPAYGGNRDLVGWKLVGFPGHQYGYKDAYINKKVDIEPIALDRPYKTEEEWRAHTS